MKNYWTQSRNNIYVCAHRGWSDRYPENTMEAMKAAVALGVDQLELDIRVTADDELVVIHDATVDRVSDGVGRVRDYTLKELQKLDVGAKKGEEFRGLRIPTFEEFMDYIRDLPDMTIDFELKEYPESDERTAYSVCDRVLKMVDECGYADRCVINSFSSRLNEYVFRKYEGRYRQHVYYPMKYLSDCTIDPYTYAYCTCMFESGAADYDYIRSRGVRTWAGASVHDEQTLDEVIACGAELITCNNPDHILELLRARGLHA